MNAQHAAFLPPCALPSPPRCARLTCLSSAPRSAAPMRRARTPRMTGTDSEERTDPPEPAMDWDAQWTDFQRSGKIANAPPGRDAVTPRELAAKRAAARVRASMQNVSSRIPSRQILFRDWRFWVVVIFALSLFSAYVNSTAMQSMTMAPGNGAGII